VDEEEAEEKESGGKGRLTGDWERRRRKSIMWRKRRRRR